MGKLPALLDEEFSSLQLFHELLVVAETALYCLLLQECLGGHPTVFAFRSLTQPVASWAEHIRAGACERQCLSLGTLPGSIEVRDSGPSVSYAY